MADGKMTFPVQTNWASATRLRGWRPASSTSFYWCCQISAADFFACFFVWWFSPSSRSSCAYLWSLIKCGSFVFLPSHNGSYGAEAALTVELQGHLQMLWLFLLWLHLFLCGFCFLLFWKWRKLQPLRFFFYFFFLCSKSSWEFKKINLLQSCLFQSSGFFAL